MLFNSKWHGRRLSLSQMRTTTSPTFYTLFSESRPLRTDSLLSQGSLTFLLPPCVTVIVTTTCILIAAGASNDQLVLQFERFHYTSKIGPHMESSKAAKLELALILEAETAHLSPTFPSTSH